MKKWMILTLMLLCVGWMFGAIDWCGNIWPNSGSDQTNGNDINVYFQIYKAGTTDAEGQGLGISATLYYKISDDAEYQSTTMSYNTDIGNNDEYVGTIPNSFFYTGDVLNFYCEANDGSPCTTSVGSYTIIAGLNQSVTVTFSVYMGSTSSYSGGVSIQGDQEPLDWTEGSNLLTDPDEDNIYTIDIEFPAGTNPNLGYKYKKNNESTWDWEGFDGNRTLTIDDSSPTQTLDPINTFGIKNADYANGWYNDWVKINKNASGEISYWLELDPEDGSTELDGYDFGGVTSLSLTGCDMKYWCNSVDRTGGSINYKIMSSDGNTEVVAPISIAWDQVALGGNDYQGTKTFSVDLLSGLDDATTYQLHVWSKSDGVVQGESYLSNNGSNYVATFTTPDGQVPITLTSFTAEAVQGVVNVTWVTESETENDHFVLRRNGEILATIDGAGTTTEPHTYAFVDRHVETGRVYSYALSDVSYGGVETVHEPVIVEIPASAATESFALEAAYPNPFNPQTTICYSLGTESHMDLSIYNTNGIRVATLFSGERETGHYESNWYAGNMPSGIYLIRMTTEVLIFTQKVVLMK